MLKNPCLHAWMNQPKWTSNVNFPSLATVTIGAGDSEGLIQKNHCETFFIGEQIQQGLKYLPHCKLFYYLYCNVNVVLFVFGLSNVKEIVFLIIHFHNYIVFYAFTAVN